MSDFAATEEKPVEAEEKKVDAPVVAPAVATTTDGGGEEDDGDDDGPAPEEESTATFTPVVHLEAVEVNSGEEEETILYKERAKLFSYGENMLDKGTGNKTWNEKGTGDVKLLKHKENCRIRILMRQEKTMKVIANHIIDPQYNLTPNAGASDKSWVWVAWDFSDGELVETTFAIRFKSPEISQEFKAAFTSAQVEMKTLLAGGDSETGAAEADEAAAAIASLAVKSELFLVT